MTDRTRREITRDHFLERLPKGGTAAEIGVWEGRFSERILEIARPERLHLIDPWLYQPEFSNTGFGRRKNAGRMEEMFHDVVSRLGGRPEVTIHRGMSEAILTTFSDGSLDWVYVDGNHNAPFVDRDLDLCLRKVRRGGLICGDDLNWRADDGAPVRTAVETLVSKAGAELSVMANQYMIRLPA